MPELGSVRFAYASIDTRMDVAEDKIQKSISTAKMITYFEPYPNLFFWAESVLKIVCTE